jgi:DNA invertase Pin-like site-specific DNA recombinase
MYRNEINLSGDGAVYVRTSTDQQDTQRQYAAVQGFLERHGAVIPRSQWFEDEGWARDTADRRPNFQRLLHLVKAGRVNWIVLDRLDRFGWKSSKQLMHLLYQLEEAGCRLYDADGKEWTGEDDATEITALIEGKNSVKETRERSYRVLGGMVEKARDGQFLGGGVRLGFDIVCYTRESGTELWRVNLEGRDKRVKVYPDGRTERFDGKNNFPKVQPMTEVLRLAPSKDKAKRNAALGAFERYATESISFTALGHWLNNLGMRTCYDRPFTSRSLQEMLADPIYLGYYSWNKVHRGKFHRHKDGQAILELNYEGKQSRNSESDWVQSRRLFDPLVPLSTWNEVQDKLRNRTTRAKAPTSHRHYLAGLLVCGNCGSPLIVGRPYRDREEYFCSGYMRKVRSKGKDNGACNCLRNAIYQHEIEPFLERYLEETGQRLEILTGGMDIAHPADHLHEEYLGVWDNFENNLRRLVDYLRERDPEGYDDIVRLGQDFAMVDNTTMVDGSNRSRDNRPAPTATEIERMVIGELIRAYRGSFDAGAIRAEIQELDSRHDSLIEKYAGLTDARARKKIDSQLTALGDQIETLQQQMTNVGDVVEGQFREMLDLGQAIEEAKRAFKAEACERALRQKAEAIRKVVQRIEFRFTATGLSGKGPGHKAYKLAKVTIYPLVGDPLEMGAKRVLQPPYELAYLK